jgi:hypothetical protein
VNELQRWRNEFKTPPPALVRIAWLHGKFEICGTVQNVNKEYFGWHHSSTYNGSVETLLQTFTQSPRKYVRQCCRETGVYKTSVIIFCSVRSGNFRRWIGQRGSVGYSPQSPDLTPLHFCLLDDLRNTVCQKTKNTARPEAKKWNWLCCSSTSNNAINMPLCCMSLLTVHWGWWWTFWTFVSLRYSNQHNNGLTCHFY